MRSFLLLSALLLSGATLTPALALDAGDTMQAWKSATNEERAALLEALLGKGAAANAKVARCMTDTSNTPGHSDLPIGEVAKVCAASGNDEQPV